MNNYLLIVFDSCRYDSLIAARPKILRKPGRIERHCSYASWSETHYSYALAGEPSASRPRLSGVHGVFRHLDAHAPRRRTQTTLMNARQLAELRRRQIDAVRFLDGATEQLFDQVPRNTYITVTSDHGELLGQDGYFGHGPIQHPKVLEIPFVEGKIR